MSKVKGYWEKYKYLGYDRKTIQSCREWMDEDNLAVVSGVSFLLLFLLGIMTAFYLAFDNNPTRNMVCIISFVVMLVIYIVSKRLLRDTGRITSQNVDALVYTLMGACFAVGVYLGTFAVGDEMAVPSIWMFFFAILIFNRLPQQNLPVLIISGAVFIICSYLTKRPYIFHYDVMHTFVSVIASMAVSWSKSRMKIINILALKRLESANLQIMETVEEQEKRAAVLQYQASRDELTGLLKKKVFESKVIEVLSGSDSNDQHALVCIDIDDFKQLNDRFGHLYGDGVLKEIAFHIENQTGWNNLAGRFGGDEFVLFFQGIDEKEFVENRVAEIIKAARKKCCVNGTECMVTLSAGIAFYPDCGASYGKLFECADKALYLSKEEGKDRCTVG